MKLLDRSHELVRRVHRRDEGPGRELIGLHLSIFASSCLVRDKNTWLISARKDENGNGPRRGLPVGGRVHGWGWLCGCVENENRGTLLFSPWVKAK